MFSEVPDDQMPPGMQELLDALAGGEVAGIHAIKVPEGVDPEGMPPWAMILFSKMSEICDRLGYIKGIHSVLEAKALITPGHREALNFIYARGNLEAAKGPMQTMERTNELIGAVRELEATGLASAMDGLADRMQAMAEQKFADIIAAMQEEDEGCGD